MVLGDKGDHRLTIRGVLLVIGVFGNPFSGYLVSEPVCARARSGDRVASRIGIDEWLSRVFRAVLPTPAREMSTENCHADRIADLTPRLILLALLFGDPRALVVTTAVGSVAVQRTNRRHLGNGGFGHDANRQNTP
jgi:hypothetical protein